MYVSDKPQRHDTRLLKKLVLPDGSVLRASQAGRPTRDCLFADVCADGRSVLKIWNVNAHNGVLALLNIQGASWDWQRRRYHRFNSTILWRLFRRAFMRDEAERSLQATFCPADVDLYNDRVPDNDAGVSNDGEQDTEASNQASFAVYVRDTKDSGELLLLGLHETHSVDVAPGSALVATVAPITSSPADATMQAAVLGLSNMLNGGGAVKQLSWSLAAGDGWPGVPQLSVDLLGCGTLLMYSSRRPRRVFVNGTPADGVVFDPEQGQLQIQVAHDPLSADARVTVVF